ncbi:MAG TPA: endonuclease/exonuclease/phosphatase family protein [Lacipirellulaceae bacterium]|nr:endonuclease/exonuclease/phosphatase family protein [Lacipirellulaceae bacterium]
MQFRLLTYNIHKGIGGIDRRYDLARIVETIAHYRPDFALLQEVDDGAPRSQLHCQCDMLAEALALPHRSYQRNVRLKIGHYGNALLSRHPLSDVVDLDLTIPFKKRRAALIARAHVAHKGHTRTVAIANVHLGLAGFERTIQLRRLLATDCLSGLREQTPLVVAGDFNDVYGNLGRRVMQPAGFRLASGHGRTFPAAAPLRRLDRVFFRGNLHPAAAFVGHTALARRASDHLPLIVDFELPLGDQ